MPKLVNKNAHGIRVTSEDGRETRLRAGQVMEASGELADLLSGVANVQPAKKEDVDAWEAVLAASRHDAGQGMDNILAQARVAVSQATISAPLNVVIGDNDAPMGPPTGTVTTKQAMMREGGDNKRAFGDHERLPEEAEDEGLSEVERIQAEAKAAVEELSQDLIDSGKPSKGRGRAKQKDDAADASGG